MKYLAPILLGLTSLGGCQTPTTTAQPATLLGLWKCDTATSVAVDRAGQPIGEADTSQFVSQVLAIAPTSILMPDITPGDTTEWTYTRRHDTLFVQYVRLQGRPYTLADTWRVATLTPTTLVVERTIQDEEQPPPHRYQWHYHRAPRQ